MEFWEFVTGEAPLVFWSFYDAWSTLNLDLREGLVLYAIQAQLVYKQVFAAILEQLMDVVCDWLR